MIQLKCGLCSGIKLTNALSELDGYRGLTFYPLLEEALLPSKVRIHYQIYQDKKLLGVIIRETGKTDGSKNASNQIINHGSLILKKDIDDFCTTKSEFTKDEDHKLLMWKNK